MSGKGKKIGKIGKKVVTGLVGIGAALNLGEIILGNKDNSSLKLVIPTLITSLIQILPILVVIIVKDLKTVKLFFFFNTKAHFNNSIVFF